MNPTRVIFIFSRVQTVFRYYPASADVGLVAVCACVGLCVYVCLCFYFNNMSVLTNSKPIKLIYKAFFCTSLQNPFSRQLFVTIPYLYKRCISVFFFQPILYVFHALAYI